MITDEVSGAEYHISIRGFVDAIPMGVLKVKNRKINLGTLESGEKAAFEVRVYNAGDGEMKITSIVSKKRKTVYFTGNVQIKPKETKVFHLTASPEKTGRFIDHIMIHSDARNVTTKGYKVIAKGSVK